MATRLETTAYSPLGRHPNNQSGGRIRTDEGGHCASPVARAQWGTRVQRIPEPPGRCPARVSRAHSGTVRPQLGRAQQKPSSNAPGAVPESCPARPRGSVRRPGNRAELLDPGHTHSTARRPARAPVRVRHPQSRFRTGHPAPHRCYGEPRGPKSGGSLRAEGGASR